MAARRDLVKDSAERRFKRFLLWLGFFVVLPIFVLLIGGLIFLNQERFAFKTISVEGQGVIPVEQIKNVVQEVLTGRNRFGFRYNRSWFYPRAKLEPTLLRHFPRLALANTQIVEGNSLLVRVRERRPSALWCESDCYYLDEAGMVFAPAPQFSLAPFLIFRGTWPPAVAATSTAGFFGRQPLPRIEFIRLRFLASALGELTDSLLSKARDLKVSSGVVSIIITPEGDYDFQLPVGFRVSSRRDQSQESILALVETIFKDETFFKRWQNGEELDYLDLRFDDKIFYRFRE